MRQLAILVSFYLGVACSGGSSQTPAPNPAPVASGSEVATPTEPGSMSDHTTPPAGAGGYQTPPADAGGAPSVPPGGGSSPQSGTKPKLHEKCGPDDSCGVGTCVTYYGIAGAKGPQFKTCEIKCDAAAKCPDGMTCSTVADGPGQVCH